MRGSHPAAQRFLRALVGSLLVLGTFAQTVPAPHAPGLHPQEETETSRVESGCRESHSASFEARIAVETQPCAACLGNLQGRAILASGGPAAVLVEPGLRTMSATEVPLGVSSPGPPPARGPPLA